MANSLVKLTLKATNEGGDRRKNRGPTLLAASV